MATIRKRGEAYQLQWRENGRQHRVSLGKVGDAEAERQRQIKELELATGLRVDHTTGQARTERLREFLRDQYLPWHRSRYPDSHYRTLQVCEQHLIPALGGLSLRDITARRVERYMDLRALHVKPATVNKELRVLKAALNRAMKWDYPARELFVDPLQELNSKAPDFYSPADLDALYQADPEAAPWWRFLVNTGMRRGEALHARREWVKDGAIYIESTQERRTKAGRWRLVPLSPGALDALEELGEDYLLPRMYPQSLSRRFSTAAERAGVGGSLHWLRHTFCTQLVIQGVHLRVIQKLAGHSTITVTERYAKAAPGQLTEAVANLAL